MSKVINSICDNCESEFTLSFNQNLVLEHEQIYCPFCNTVIEETLEEDSEEEFDKFSEEIWND